MKNLISQNNSISKKISFTSRESERLTLRHIQERDFDSLFAYRNDEQVAQYQEWKDTTESEIRALIEEQKLLDPGIPGAWFMFSVELNKNKEMIGDCAIFVNATDSRQVELGITLSRTFQRQGYAKETILCVLNFIFNYLNLQRVVFITYSKNLACIKLLRSLNINQVDPSVGFKNTEPDKALYDLKDNELMFAVSKDQWIGIST